MQEEAGGGEALSTPLIGGGEGVPSLCLARVGSMAYTAAHTQNKKSGVAQVGRQVWRPTVHGYTIPLVKLMKRRGTMHKIGRKMMFLRMSGMICQNFCLNLHRFIRAV